MAAKFTENVKFTENALEDFKKLVRKAIFINHGEEHLFASIPNEKWAEIFEKNFNGNMSYAQRVLLKQFRDVQKIDLPRVEAESQKIWNLEKAAKQISDWFDAKKPVIFVTDVDNDGSFSQAVVNEYWKIDPESQKSSYLQYAQTVNGNNNRGVTVDLVDKVVEHEGIDPDSDFLIVTADNGINSRDEQIKIQAKFPNAKLIVTDHHNPDPGLVVQEDANSLIFNPHYKPTEFYKKFNISGAATLAVLMRKVLETRVDAQRLEDCKRHIENIRTLSRVANLLDYVDTDPMDKPEKDYVVTKFLQLQGLMNVNNSLNKIILGGLPRAVVAQLKTVVPDLNEKVLREEARNIQTQNFVAKILLKMHKEHKDNVYMTAEDFGVVFVRELNDASNYEISDDINLNYIEQLRPVIFNLSVDDEKSAFAENLCAAMVQVYETIRASEKKMAGELRKGSAVRKSALPNSTITYAEPGVLQAFNRKFMGKVYNEENPGFIAMLDSVSPAKVSGSFRSLHDISEILPEDVKHNLELDLNVRIETPGHERAAGFIIKSADPESDPITEEKIGKINAFISERIEGLKEQEADAKESRILTDLSAIGFIDRINKAIRGNICNFERIVPLLKLTPDTIWTDSYTTEQYSMEDISARKSYGYISINTDFHGGTVIVPVELVKRIVADGYKGYLSINYMDEGVFMAERVVSEEQASEIIDLRGTNEKSIEILKVFEKDLKDKNIVDLNRDQVKDNPFFKYNDLGESDFDLFERMVIGIIEDQGIDTLAVFDVEANGFGNGKLMNFGSMNYSVEPGSGEELDEADFDKRLFRNQRGEQFLLSDGQMAELKQIPASEKHWMKLHERRALLLRPMDREKGQRAADTYYWHPSFEEEPKKGQQEQWPFKKVRNFLRKGGKVMVNRQIRAQMLAYLVRDGDFKVPQEMTNLTGITQELLESYGKPTAQVDKEVAAFYAGKNVLFGAHNTPYDSRILRANAPEIYKTLRANTIYDSALFCKEEKLSYDEVKVSSFHGIDGLPQNVVFYNNSCSGFNLCKFIEQGQDGYYPDRSGNYLLGCDGGEFYFIDKKEHEIVKLQASSEELLAAVKLQSIPNVAVKYSVEKLSEQWMTHALLLSDEQFDIKYVDLSQAKYEALRSREAELIFFQDNYLFDASAGTNLSNFKNSYYAALSEEEMLDNQTLEDFVEEFLSLNKAIHEKFSDSWMYKAVLSIKDPTRTEVTNDLVDLVHYQTNLPKDKIRSIFSDAIKFKEKYKISHILQHEGHVNGPWEGDSKGDIAFEDKLTLSLLARRMYDPFSADISVALTRFTQAAVKAQLAFDLSHHMSEGSAHDSYSYRQGLLYKRDDQSGLINSIQEREAMLADEKAEHVVKFKLGNDVLPAETSVCAIVKRGVALSRADIEEDAKKLDFILVNEQVRNSLDKIDNAALKEDMETILEANEERILQFKEELSEHYRYVEVSKRDLQLKKLLEAVIKTAHGTAVRKPKAEQTEHLSEQDVDIVEQILDAHVKACGVGLSKCSSEYVDEAKALLNEVRKDLVPTTLSLALDAGPGAGGFKSMSEVRDPYFLSRVEISRQQPMKILLSKFPQLKLCNKIIEENIPAQADQPRPGRRF